MDAIPRFETLTRLGFAARGVLYLLIAYLAIAAGRNSDSSDVMRSMADGGGSRLVLGLIALGLFAYGAWRTLSAAYDLEGAGRNGKGAIARAGQALSGAVHIVMGLFAAGLALGVLASGAGGETSDKAAGWLMDLPGGELMLRLLALAFMLGGLFQAWSAYRLKFLEQLDGRAARQAWIRWVGRLGYIARGVVFVLIGVLLWRAAGAHAPSRAGGLAEALDTLSGASRLVVAAGLGMFGAFSLVQAVYRRITSPDVVRRFEHRRRPAGGRGATVRH